LANFHNKPFDQGTRVKLDLFAKYVEAWLPVFLSIGTRPRKLTIVDFFAGPGKDADGSDGSPLVLLREIRKYTRIVESQGSTISLELNEANTKKAKKLQTVMEEQQIPRRLCTWKVYSQQFEEAFARLYPTLQKGPNLIFLDQQGMKFISDSVFRQMTALPQTDFIFFIASSFIRRFSAHPYFKKHLAIPSGSISGRSFNDTHRVVTDYYRGLTSEIADYFIGSFSIKKNSNLYGLVFGSQHPKGLEKFLRICWKIDPDRGEANFDIDDDGLDARNPHLFPEMDIAKKVALFQHRLELSLLHGEIKTDGEVYLRCLKDGMLPMHGKSVVMLLKKSSSIRVQSNKQPRVSIEGFRSPRELEVITRGSE
jgi:three-Cys-motif partner protein